MTTATLPVLSIAPAQVVRGEGILTTQSRAIAALGQRPLVVGGRRTLKLVQPLLATLEQGNVTPKTVPPMALTAVKSLWPGCTGRQQAIRLTV